MREAESLPASGAIARGEHVMALRVFYEDTDAGGVVYYANYLKFAERARTEMLRLLGFEQRALAAERGLAFAVARCEIDYLKPARLDDVVRLHTRVLEVRRASLRLKQSLRRDGADLVRLAVRLACVGPGGRPARLPDDLFGAFRPLLPAG
ncbi:MAG: tol-pal system-associated acyl-CoA thioesterase [Proteobacteria bacterium]|nr:tol-pal system-associated acyl-CoA thioesterase [Pseudomonadota bacterium]